MPAVIRPRASRLLCSLYIWGSCADDAAVFFEEAAVVFEEAAVLFEEAGDAGGLGGDGGVAFEDAARRVFPGGVLAANRGQVGGGGGGEAVQLGELDRLEEGPWQRELGGGKNGEHLELAGVGLCEVGVDVVLEVGHRGVVRGPRAIVRPA